MLKLKELREQRGIGQEELARGIGSSSKSIGRWECGSHSPSLENLEKLALFFGIPVSELISSEAIIDNSVPDTQPQVKQNIPSDVPKAASTPSAETLTGREIINMTGGYIADIKRACMDEEDIQIVRTMLETVDRLLDRKAAALQPEPEQPTAATVTVTPIPINNREKSADITTRPPVRQSVADRA